ncbi:MAG TPA: hypothetical protein VMT97_09720, partial [Terriglobales bacterium]|nr:hypothetical protein [Terriglobales bacterium]
MGVSDRYHFEWLTSSLGRFEAEQGALASIARQSPAPVVWCLAEQRETPPIAYLRTAVGGQRT